MSDPDDHSKCPLAAVDRRLEDVHRQWHHAEREYFDPGGFRVAIQTAIQTLRTVTFVLQRNKHLLDNFDRWYGPWQQKLREDRLMLWMVEARNKIEKQGDLEAHSLIRAEIVASHLGGPKIEVLAKLFQDIFQLVTSIPRNELGDHIRKNGVLRIQRRWVENTLPDHELLDAVAIAYGRIAELVHDAHRQLGLEAPVTKDEATGTIYGEGARGGRLPCMIGHSETRSLDIWLATGRPIKLTEVEYKINLKGAEKLLGERYGVDRKDILGGGDGPEGVLQSLFATARKMFVADNHHVTIAFLLHGNKPVKIAPLQLNEHGEMYLIMGGLENEVVKHDADAVVLIGETWIAPAESVKPYQGAADSPQRMEALHATLASKTGEPVTLTARIERTREGVSLGKTDTQRGGAAFAFAPVYKVWGREIPKEWLGQSPSSDGEQSPR